jgi:outer membrane protein assembly factor BamA
MKRYWSTLFLLLSTIAIYAQEVPDTTHHIREFKRIDILPAISYTPETNLTLGVIGYYYLDLSKGTDFDTRISNINFLAAYTLANQIAIEANWELFGTGNVWRYRGKAFYNKYPDRNYGLGNTAGALITDVDGEEVNTYNYLRFNSDRIHFAPAVLRRVANNLYVGVQAELEYLYDLKPIPDAYGFQNAETEAMFETLPVEGFRSGIGLQVLYDTRDYILNPIKGHFVQLSNYNYTHLMGSEFDFSSYLLDARTYINPWSNHTIALRGIANFRFSDEPIPLRALSRVGGRDLIRGYFKGTYQDNHMLAFEAEYRLPFWKEDLDASFWKIWKRLGVVAFVGGAQVANDVGDFTFNDFHLAVGGGLRILFNKKSRVNLRIDYGVGLAPDAGGVHKRQSGLYFYLAEAF